MHLEGFDESSWDRPDLPTRAELDELTALPVVVTRTDGHLCVASSALLAEVDLTGADGVEVGVDGEPTGRLTKEASRRVGAWVESSYDGRLVEEFQLQAAGLAASRGVTAVHEMSMDLADLEVLLRHRERLPVDVSPIPATLSLPEAIERGFLAIGGDLPVDGSIGAKTAALAHPYEDGQDQGELFHDDDTLA